MKSKQKIVIQSPGQFEEMVVPFSKEEFEELEKVAKTLGITPAGFIETTILERLEKIKQART
jgi:hypothetical protein